jgi:hypothetical protein
VTAKTAVARKLEPRYVVAFKSIRSGFQVNVEQFAAAQRSVMPRITLPHVTSSGWRESRTSDGS